MLLIKSQVNWPFGSREEKKNRFQDGDHRGHLGFPIGTILAIFFIYKSPRCFRPTFKSTSLSVEEKKLKIDFKDGGHGVCHPMLLIKFQVNCPFCSGEEAKKKKKKKKKKKDFQDRNDFSYLAICDLQVTVMLPTKFQVNWSFGSWEEAKNSFSRGLPWRPSLNSDRNNFSYFLSISHPDASYRVSGQLAFLVQEEKREINFQDGRQDVVLNHSAIILYLE